MPFIASLAIGAGLLTYGGIRTWRMDRRWWWPAVVAVLGVPLLFLMLFVASGT
jgi:drug/metabolite transporter (DMT)-like permease